MQTTKNEGDHTPSQREPEGEQDGVVYDAYFLSNLSNGMEIWSTASDRSMHRILTCQEQVIKELSPDVNAGGNVTMSVSALVKLKLEMSAFSRHEELKKIASSNHDPTARLKVITCELQSTEPPLTSGMYYTVP